MYEIYPICKNCIIKCRIDPHKEVSICLGILNKADPMNTQPSDINIVE
jgi:hypothetical protein